MELSNSADKDMLSELPYGVNAQKKARPFIEPICP
jgi:hypothetical protein